MPFDPNSLAPLLGGLGGATGGGNGFLRGWQRAQQESEQRRLQQEQMGMAREDRDFRRQQAASTEQRAQSAETRAEQDQAIQIAQTFRELLGDETIDDPEAFNQRLTFASQFAPTLGVETGFLESLRPAPTVFQRRKAAKLLKSIETDPQIKRLVDAGEDIGAIVYEREDLGPNPERPDGKPLWSIGEIHRLAQRPTPAQPLPKVPPKADAPNTLEEKLADAIRRGDQAEIDVLTKAAETISGARRAPDDPVLGELRQLRLEQQRAGQNSTALPPSVQRRVDMKTRGFDAQPVVKRIQTMAEAVQFSAGLDPATTNPADDQALIYAFAKAMDPDSVVREGEYATVQKYAQSWAERFGFEVARMVSNTTFLTPQARANMKATIRSRYASAKPQYENLRRSYAKQISQITGQGDGDSYLVDYASGFPDGGGDGGAGSAGAAGASYEEYLKAKGQK